MRFRFHVRYWMDNQLPSSGQIQPIESSVTSCRLEKLVPDTKYFVDIRIVSFDKKKISFPTQHKEFKTAKENVRFGKILKKLCEKVEIRNGMKVHFLPLTKSVSFDPVQRYVFGQPGNNEGTSHKTILILGASGSGKTSLINGMLNFVFGVSWKDPFRFQLDQTDSLLNVYDIHHYEGLNVEYSLTIVDTPGYGENEDKNREITKTIQTFFEGEGGEQQLDLVAFVMKSTQPKPTATDKFIYQSMVSIFGEDIKKNIKCMLTFADKKEDPPLLSNIADSGLPSNFRLGHLKFENSVFFCCNNKPELEETLYEEGGVLDLKIDCNYNNFLWSVAEKSFYTFFHSMDQMETKSISRTKKLLYERKRMESTVDGLESLIEIGLLKMEELMRIDQQIDKHNIGFSVPVAVPQKFAIPLGQYLTNCTQCNVTCHKSCGSESKKHDCDVMDHSKAIPERTCLVCNCMWDVHESQPFRWEYVRKAEMTTPRAIQRKYEEKMKYFCPVRLLIPEIKKDVEEIERVILNQFQAVAYYKKQLRRSESRTVLQLINMMINKEKKKKFDWWFGRMKSLKRIRLWCVLQSFVSI